MVTLTVQCDRMLLSMSNLDWTTNGKLVRAWKLDVDLNVVDLNQYIRIGGTVVEELALYIWRNIDEQE